MSEECIILKVIHSFEMFVPTCKTMHATTQKTMINIGNLLCSLKVIYKYYYFSKHYKGVTSKDIMDDDDGFIFLFVDS
jgi:hypothetical protein